MVFFIGFFIQTFLCCAYGNLIKKSFKKIFNERFQRFVYELQSGVQSVPYITANIYCKIMQPSKYRYAQLQYRFQRHPVHFCLDKNAILYLHYKPKMLYSGMLSGLLDSPKWWFTLYMLIWSLMSSKLISPKVSCL